MGTKGGKEITSEPTMGKKKKLPRKEEVPIYKGLEKKTHKHSHSRPNNPLIGPEKKDTKTLHEFR